MNKKTIHLKGDLFLFRFSFLANQFLYGKEIYYLKLDYRIQKSSLKAECEVFFLHEKARKKSSKIKQIEWFTERYSLLHNNDIIVTI